MPRQRRHRHVGNPLETPELARSRAAKRAGATAAFTHASGLFAPLGGDLYVNRGLTWSIPAFGRPGTLFWIEGVPAAGAYFAASLLLFWLVYRWIRNPRMPRYAAGWRALLTTFAFALVPSLLADKAFVQLGILLMGIVGAGMCYGTAMINMYDRPKLGMSPNDDLRRQYHRTDATGWQSRSFYILLGTLTVLLTGLQLSATVGHEFFHGFPMQSPEGQAAVARVFGQSDSETLQVAFDLSATVAARMWTAVIAVLSFGTMFAGADQKASAAMRRMLQ